MFVCHQRDDNFPTLYSSAVSVHHAEIANRHVEEVVQHQVDINRFYRVPIKLFLPEGLLRQCRSDSEGEKKTTQLKLPNFIAASKVPIAFINVTVDTFFYGKPLGHKSDT